ncbi:MAG: hypothetical protein F7C82_01060 [Desulfurococcales archaeon]|nr:hypothetical protein [Desulfurococcales archaeon]MCE4623112.1 hypothetical protein [Desulfurococcales archaeon]MCE4628850.1 hypothetical protein [Desulfurococcales archaeon]
MTCWRGEKPECKAKWIVCDENLVEGAQDFLDVYSQLSVDNVNVRMVNDGELVRYAYINSKGAGFVLEIDPGIMDPNCLGPIKSALVDKLTQALYGDPRWQLLYHIIERQMLPTP